MIQRIRCGIRLFGKDIRALLPAILALAWYWLVTHLLFDRFCPMQILLGLPCPGCGMTRAFMLVLTGRFAAAWSLQPPVYGWIVAGACFGIQRYLVDSVGTEYAGPAEMESGKGSSDVEKQRSRRAKMWIWVLLVLLIWGVGLYLWRVLHGFPMSVEDPGYTLYEVLTV